MPEKLDARVIEAAGGIVERRTPHATLIAVIHRERYGTEWALPKGKRQAGESWQQAALREVEEEIGVKPIITGIAGATAYLADGVPKLVLYWRMVTDSDTSHFTPNDEVVELLWLTPAQAIERLTHREEADVVKTAYPHGEQAE